MHITIEYCTVWSYEPRAVRLAAELEAEFPEAKIELREGSGGRFEVSKDGSPIFQKSKLGRHAEPGEIVGLLRAVQ